MSFIPLVLVLLAPPALAERFTSESKDGVFSVKAAEKGEGFEWGKPSDGTRAVVYGYRSGEIEFIVERMLYPETFHELASRLAGQSDAAAVFGWRRTRGGGFGKNEGFNGVWQLLERNKHPHRVMGYFSVSKRASYFFRGQGFDESTAVSFVESIGPGRNRDAPEKGKVLLRISEAPIRFARVDSCPPTFYDIPWEETGKGDRRCVGFASGRLFTPSDGGLFTVRKSGGERLFQPVFECPEGLEAIFSHRPNPGDRHCGPLPKDIDRVPTHKVLGIKRKAR